MYKEESDALLELERLVRVVAYKSVGEGELAFWKQVFKGQLEAVNEARRVGEVRKREQKALRQQKEKLRR